MESTMDATCCSAGLNQMPSELLMRIYETTDPEDVQNARLVCKKLYNFVKLNTCYLPRVKLDVTFEGTTEGLLFACGRIRLILKSLDDLQEALTNYCSTIEIAHLKIKHILENDFHGVVGTIVETLKRCRQFEISAFSLKNVHLPADEMECLASFLPAIAKSCKDMSIENSNFTVNELRVFVGLRHELSHLRVLETPKDEMTEKLSGEILQIVGRQFNEKDRVESFAAEVDQVSPEAVCDFLKSWLRASVPFFFNLTVVSCDVMWMTRFMETCFQADLRHQYFEFASKVHPTAHVKVCFSENNETCRLWPIFDVPPKTNGFSYCSARYFRDF